MPGQSDRCHVFETDQTGPQRRLNLTPEAASAARSRHCCCKAWGRIPAQVLSRHEPARVSQSALHLQQPEQAKLTESKFDRPAVFVVGNEGSGIREKSLELCDIKLSIPMHARTESLNAAVSAAVVFYEWSRQNPGHLG